MKSREETIEFIEYCTATLKGHMSNLDRALMCADLKDAREYLAKLEADATAAAHSAA